MEGEKLAGVKLGPRYLQLYISISEYRNGVYDEAKEPEVEIPTMRFIVQN